MDGILLFITFLLYLFIVGYLIYIFYRKKIKWTQ